MPLLVCPNGNAAMQTMNRAGAEFDFCPSCRGVWLDRGELEKMMDAGRADAEPAGEGAVSKEYAQHDRRGLHRRAEDDDGTDWNDDDYRRKPRRGRSIFDIFD